jgi:hypothetical protein
MARSACVGGGLFAWFFTVGVLALLAPGCGDDLRGLDDDGGAADGSDDGGEDDGADGGDGGVVACPPEEMPGALADADWDPRFTIAGVTGQDGLTPKVFDLALDGEGGVLATGYFQYLGAARVEPLLRADVDGAWQPARERWELPVPPAGFGAVAVGPRGELALASYDPLGERSSQIWLDTGGGLEVIGRASGLIRALKFHGGALWAGGNFQLAGTDIAGLAVWNGAAWSAAPGGAVNGPVYELAEIGDSLFAAGGFTSVGGVAAQRVAEWNGAAWIAYDLPYWGVGVYALATGPDGTIYAGGAFSDSLEPGGSGGAARWTGSEWEILGGGVANPFFGGVVTDVAEHLGEIYVTGCFSHVDGPPDQPGAIASRELARWTGTAWEAFGQGAGAGSPWFEFAACGDEGPDAIWDVPHQRLLSDGKTLYVSGSLSGAGGVASQSLIGFSGEEWVAQGTADLGVAGTVIDLAVSGPGCSLYAFGGISHTGGEPAPGGLARFDGSAWSAIGAPLPAFHYCVGQAVSEAGEVYIGCYDQTSDVLASHVYRLGDGEWQAIGEPHGLEAISDLAMDRTGRLWVVGGLDSGYLARLDGDRFTVLEDGFDSFVSRIAIAPDGDDEPALVVGGAFSRIGSIEVSRVAHWDGAQWSALGDGVTSGVMALEYGARAIYVATGDEGNPGRRILAAWDGAQWTELATPERGLPAPMGKTVHTFTALREIGDQLLAVGYVWPETGGRNAFLYDGERFTSIGGGIAAISVDAVAVGRDGLWFGGTIAEVGGDDPIPSVGVAHLRWPDR